MRSLLSVTAYVGFLADCCWCWSGHDSCAKKIAALGRHPFWLNKSDQGDFYAIGALSNSNPAKVWIRIINSSADAAFENALDSWSVFAHVDANIRRCEYGFFRNGSSHGFDSPTLLQNSNPIPFLPMLDPSPLPNSQSGETSERLMSVRSTTTRSHWESELGYLRESP